MADVVANKPGRHATVSRTTKETDIHVRPTYAHVFSLQVELTLDGNGEATVNTGIGFLDHMLSALAKHSQMDLVLRCKVRTCS